MSHHYCTCTISRIPPRHPYSQPPLLLRHIWSRRSQDTRAFPLFLAPTSAHPTSLALSPTFALHVASTPPYSSTPGSGFSASPRSGNSHETSSSPPPAVALSNLGTHVDLNAARNLRHTHCFNISNKNEESYSLLRSSRLVSLLSRSHSHFSLRLSHPHTTTLAPHLP